MTDDDLYDYHPDERVPVTCDECGCKGCHAAGCPEDYTEEDAEWN